MRALELAEAQVARDARDKLVGARWSVRGVFACSGEFKLAASVILGVAIATT